MINILSLTNDESDAPADLATVTEILPCDDLALREAFQCAKKLDGVAHIHGFSELPVDAMVVDTEDGALNETRQAQLVKEIYSLLGLPAAQHLNGLAEAVV